MKKNVLFLFCLFTIIASCSKSDDKDDKQPLPPVSVIEMSAESDWDYWVTGPNDNYYLETNNNTPRGAVYHSTAADKDYSVLFDENGLPDKIIVDGYTFVVRNFDGELVDVGLLDPDGNIEVFREIDSNYDWSGLLPAPRGLEQRALNLNGVAMINWVGRVLQGIPCIISQVAIELGGTELNSIKLWSCGSPFASLSTNLSSSYSIWSSLSGFLNRYDATNLGCSGSLSDCFINRAETYFEWLTDDHEWLSQHASQIQSIDAVLAYGYGDIQVTLTWDNGADLDLYVTDPNGDEVWYQNMSVASGGELDVDDTDGFGPENIFWPDGEAPVGMYEVSVHHYVWENQPERPTSANYTVVVTAFGRTQQFTGTVAKGETDAVINFNENGFVPVLSSQTRSATSSGSKKR